MIKNVKNRLKRMEVTQQSNLNWIFYNYSFVCVCGGGELE